MNKVKATKALVLVTEAASSQKAWTRFHHAINAFLWLIEGYKNHPPLPHKKRKQ